MLARAVLLSVPAALTMSALPLAAVEIDLAASAADLSIWGGAPGGTLGMTVAVGDLNGDGIDDLAFEDPLWRNPFPAKAGRACVYFGPFALPATLTPAASSPPLCIVANDRGSFLLGPDALGIADLDLDGIGDLVVGARGTWADGRDAVWIFRGRTAWPAMLSLIEADWTFIGAEVGDEFSNFTIGDLTGDGAPDLALFASGAGGPGNLRKGAGEAYVFFGPVSGWARTVDLAVDAPDVHIIGADGTDDNPRRPGPGGSYTADNIGSQSRCWIADLLGDPIPDLVFAAAGGAGPTNTRREAGELYVLRGRAAWPAEIDLRFAPRDLLVYGPFEDSQLGAAAIGDWDGDSRADLLVSTMTAPAGVTRDLAGTVYVLLGGAGLGGVRDLARPADASAWIVGPRASSVFGYRLALADVDGDRYLDLVSAGVLDPTPFGRDWAGAVLVVTGCGGIEPSRDLATKPAELAVYAEAGDTLGLWSALATADVDDDGRADIFVGAQGGDSEGNAVPDAGEAHLILGRELGSPVCTVSPDPGPGAATCGVADVPLDGSATTVAGCALAPQYRWLAGATVVRDWSADPAAVVRPTTTTTYRLEIRCGDCTGPCFGSAEVLVTVDPDVVPPTLANTLMAVRSSATDLTLSWAGVSEARSYAIYRSTARKSWPPTAFLAGIVDTTISLPDVASPPQLYYRAVGASCSGKEGP